MERARSIRDILSGLIFIGLGVAFASAALGYQIGTALRMGPGYFPLVLAGLLCALGLAVVFKGFSATAEQGDFGVIPWRGILLLSAALLFFGATVRNLGLAPSLFVSVFLAAMASRQNTFLSALLLALAMTIFCSVIFIYALGVSLPLFGRWWPI